MKPKPKQGHEIAQAVQDILRRRGLRECTAIQAAKWLHREGLLKDDKSRPGRPLRVLLRKCLVKGAQKIKQNGEHWMIRRVQLGSK